MLITICTVRQLPQAFALAESFIGFTANKAANQVVIGLANDPALLPPGFQSPYPLVPIGEVLTAGQLAELSAQYTPTEFVAACKPLFIAEVFRRYPDTDKLIYADPNTQFFSSPALIWEQLNQSNLLLTPFITRHPASVGVQKKSWPDEKFFQNIGLYSSDFIAFRRSAETARMLAWWDSRVRQRAYLNYCEGLCLDQIWLMHVPIFFRDVAIIKNPGWHVALWNLPERTLRSVNGSWQVSGPVTATAQSLLFINFKGLFNPDEGFFPHQNRFRVDAHPAIATLLAAYRQAVARHQLPLQTGAVPAYGQQPEPPVLRGWRYTAAQSMRAVTRFLDRIPLPALP